MDATLEKELFELATTIIEQLTSAPIITLILLLSFSRPLHKLLDSLLSRGFALGLGKDGLSVAALAAASDAVSGQETKPPELTGLTLPMLTGGDNQTSANAVSTSDAETARRDAIKNVDVPPIAVEQARRIRADLDKLGLAENEQIEVLVKQLAVTSLYLRAETTYRTIFGSQIALLKHLNFHRLGQTKADLMRFYESAKVAYPFLYAGYSSDQYFGYLLSHGLITQHEPDLYIITMPGTEFLKWMTDIGLADLKPF